MQPAPTPEYQISDCGSKEGFLYTFGPPMISGSKLVAHFLFLSQRQKFASHWGWFGMGFLYIGKCLVNCQKS